MLAQVQRGREGEPGVGGQGGGAGAFPSVATLVRYTGLSERTVRTCLDRLAAEGIISPCDPDIVAARIKRADRRPQSWDLNLSLVRDDLNDAGIAVLEHQFPGLGIRLAAAVQPGADSQSDGVQSVHPVAGRRRRGRGSRRLVGGELRSCQLLRPTITAADRPGSGM